MNEREKFLKIADEVGGDDEPDDPWMKEPWPNWFTNVVLRLARNFIPTLTVADFKKTRTFFRLRWLL